MDINSLKRYLLKQIISVRPNYDSGVCEYLPSYKDVQKWKLTVLVSILDRYKRLKIPC